MTPLKLPPKPNLNKQVEKPVAAVRPVASNEQKATEVKVTLTDGTYLYASGDAAADIYAYLMDCERYCGSHMGTVMIYFGPGLTRYNASGEKINV
jgi:hypothetical protein